MAKRDRLRACIGLLLAALLAVPVSSGQGLAAQPQPPVIRTLQAGNGFTLALRPRPGGVLQGTAVFGRAYGQITLRPDGDAYTGTLAFAGNHTPVTLTPGDAKDQWVFADGQTRLVLTGTLTPDQDTRKPHRLPLMNPGWQRYSDADGGVFEYPPDWTVQPSPQGLQLLPPKTQANREAIGVTLGPAEGLTKPDDPKIGPRLDAWVTSLNPTAQRAGPPQPFATRLGPAAVYRYTGQHPTLGGPALAKVYLVIQGPRAIGFLLSADQPLFNQREPVVDRIVASLGLDPKLTAAATQPADPATLDQRLIGRWTGENVFRLDAEVSANSRFTWQFQPDGTVFGGSQSAVNVALQDHTGTYNRGGANRTGQQAQRGRWTAFNGRLTIRWANGQRVDTAYTVHNAGRQLALRNPRGKLINFLER